VSDGADPGSLAIGAAVAGGVALAFAFVRGLFSRNVGAADDAQREMRDDVKQILVKLQSMSDEQIRQRADIAALGKENETLKSAIKAAHDRIDALVSPSPVKERKR